MNTKHISVRKGIATGLTGLLVAGALSAMAAPAHAAGVADTDVDTIGGAFVWDVSAQVVARYGTAVPTDGAFQADPAVRKVSFPLESATREGGSLELAYGGSFESQFVNRGAVLYSTTIADPIVTIDADGSGELTAVVSGSQDFAPAYPYEQTTPERVLVGSFDSTSGDLETSLDAKIGAFDAAFVDQLATGTKPHFDGSTDLKKANPFTLVQPSITAKVSTIEGDRVVEVEGKNYFGGNADYKGVYVGLAQAGGQPAGGESEEDGRKLYAGENFAPSMAVVNGSFSSFFDVKEENVVPGAPYSVYSWQAHKHTTKALDFEFPVGVLTEKVAAATRTTLTAAGTALGATLTAKVSPVAAGKVTFKEGAKTLGTVSVVNGTATLKLSGQTAGAKTYTASFAPADATSFKASAATARGTVAKATSKISTSTKKATRKKTGKITIKVKAAATATGKVKVTVKAPGKKTVVKKLTLKKGKTSLKLGKAKKKGTYKISVTYSGDKNLKAAKKKSVKYKVK